ncbi:alkaline phosphatase family protein [Candidatus Bathyarchaeota archaeon]|nr:alkaline phosphatase family protein [Candidatus Bathyarchaeota archaeon]
MVRKAMIIGLDSAVPELIKKFAEEGVLPNIKRLMKEGVFGEGFATHPTLTGTNWTTIASGTWPGTQGASCMWTHFEGEPLNRVHSSFLSTTSRCERLWETGEKIGKKSILMKYPCTVPPTIKNGIQVEGSGAPWYGLDPFEISPSMCFSNYPLPRARRVELKAASGWSNVPKSYSKPLETAVELRSKSVESKVTYNVLLIDSKGKGYDRVVISRSKDANQAVANLSVGEWSSWLKEEFEAKIPLYPKYREDDKIVYEDAPVKRYTGTFRFKLIELTPDAGRFKLYQSQIFPTTGFTWPESIAKELIDNVGPFQEHIGPNPNFCNWIDDETFLEELEYQAWWLGKASSYLLSHYEWDLFFLQWHGPNHAQHAFWGGIDPISPWYDEKNASKYWSYFRRFYGAADKMVGDIVKHADEETLVVVLSDHGHIPYVYGAAMIGNALIKAGLLAYKRDSSGKLVVDWSKTKAYPINSIHIYVNLKGRDPDGIVEPEEYEDVCNEVISTLYKIRDPKGRCPIAFALKKSEARMIGLYGDRVGDVVYGMAAGYIALLEPTEDLEEFHFTRGAISVTDDAGLGQRAGPLPPNTSIHGSSIPSSRLGLGSIRVPLIMRGPGIKKGYVMRNHFWLVDIAPTVAYILNMPPPANCEGSIILEALSQKP